jgi:uncharacterized protein DUF3223
MKLVIGSLHFSSKTAAKNFVRSIVESYLDHEKISDFEHDAFLRDLIQLHPDAVEKIGTGIDHFTIKRDDKTGKTRHFLITRIDGSFADFSWHCCIDGRNWRSEAIQTLRDAVADDIIAFRNAKFDLGDVRCAVRGELLSMETADIDHTPPLTFMRLVEEWLSLRGIRLEDIRLGPSRDLQVVYEFADQELGDSWRAFHRDKAVLRIVSKTVNRSLQRRKHAMLAT